MYCYSRYKCSRYSDAFPAEAVMSFPPPSSIAHFLTIPLSLPLSACVCVCVCVYVSVC